MTIGLPDIRSLAVLGLGRSGRAAALLVRRVAPEIEVVAVDAKDEAELGDTPRELRAAGVTLAFGGDAVLPAGVGLLVKSPGVPNESPVVEAALHMGIAVWSEVELAARFLDARWIAITGTNGKTTTTELTGQMLRDAGLAVEVAGNVGRALANLPGAVAPDAVVVAELSSFQLEHIESFRPDVAVLLNLTEDHVDRHGGYDGYVAAKLRVFENQGPDDLALINGDDPGIEAALSGEGCRAARAWACSRWTGAPAAPATAPHNSLVSRTAACGWSCRAGMLSCARSPSSPSRATTTSPTRWPPRLRRRPWACRPDRSPRRCGASRASPTVCRWSASSTA